MLPHLLHLISRSWTLLMHSTGTSTLGVFLWVAAAMVCSCLSPWVYFLVLSRIKKQKPTNNGGVPQSIFTSLVSALLFAVVILTAWIICIVFEVYDDHQALVQRNSDLLEIGPGKSFHLRHNTEYANIVNTIGTFQQLIPQELLKDRTKSCLLRITSTEDTRTVADELSHFAGLAGCSVDNPDLSTLEAFNKSKEHSQPGMIILHIREDRQEAAGVSTGLGNTYNVKISYELPSDAPPNLIWLQIGSGIVWKK